VTGSRFKVKYEYTNGILARVRDFNTPTTVYWEQVASDANGNATDVVLGNSLHTYSYFDSISGELATRTTGSSSQVQNLTYEFDKNGNLTLRKDNNLSLTERFYYDALDRLDYSTLNGSTNLDMAYDAIGNIQSKTGVGSYTYHATKKHAVVTAGTHSYGYDANGNMTTRDGSAITYTSYNLPSQVNAGSNSTQFFYGATRQRYKQISVTASGGSLPAGTETTLYVSGFFEKVTKPSTVVEYKHYIEAGGDAVAIRTLRSNSLNDTRYLHKDHLGSVDVVTDESGAVVSRLGYDAYGARRAAGTWSGAPGTGEWTAVAGVTHRGFTFHEHADNVGLIHMNGRMYDPLIGRFVSADPMIPESLGSQATNRYAYVGNNPLTITDRSGYDPGIPEITVPGTRPGPDGGGSGGGGGGGGSAQNAVLQAEAAANIDKAPNTAAPPQLAPAPSLESELAEVLVQARKFSPMKLFAFAGAGGWRSGDNPTFRELARSLGAEIYLSGPLHFLLDNAIESAENFIKENPTGHVNVMGYSAGGAVAMRFANILKEKGIPVKSIVLFDPHRDRFVGIGKMQVSGTGLEVWNFFQQNTPKLPYNTFIGTAVKGVDCTDCFIVNVNMSLNTAEAIHSNIVNYASRIHQDRIETLLKQ
jgi:RHS repeat-associated protein